MSIETGEYSDKPQLYLVKQSDTVIHAENRFRNYRSPAEKELAKQATRRANEQRHQEDDCYPAIIVVPPPSA